MNPIITHLAGASRRMARTPACLLALLMLAPPALAQTPAPATAQTPTQFQVVTSKENVPQTIISPLGKRMNLIWHDEFDAVTDKEDGKPYIDRTKWQTSFWQGGSQRSLFGNVEAEYYMDKDYVGNWKLKGNKYDPFTFEKPGILTINATKVPPEDWKKYYMGPQRCFSSGILISDKRFNFKYGYIEGRFKLPSNRGTWPAFWLLEDDPAQPTLPKQHMWPPEVDIFEFFGHRPMKHSAGIIGVKGEKLPWKFGYDEVGFDITQDFHTWALEWNEQEMALLFDGKIWAHTTTPASFHVPMYLLINLAVGGHWYSEEMTAAKTPYKPWEVDETTMPWKMECDYVRVYQEPQDAALSTFTPTPTPTPLPTSSATATPTAAALPAAKP